MSTGKRVAIVGTAPSWIQTPWDDPTLEIWGLNDAYTLGFKRVDRWFELHPTDRFYYRPVTQRVVYADDVPYGCYVRPQGHLEKLREMAKAIPVYLQNEPPKGWPPNAQRFPIEAVKAAFGEYFASGPSFEVALAILEGASEIQVWGIHLATEQEYRDQRANFEYMLGVAVGRGIKVVMANESPLMKHGWQYAYQPKPAMHPAKVQLLQVRHAKSDLIVAMAKSPRKGAADRLRRLEALELDCIRALQHREPMKITVPVLQVGA
jgi:hypothetical protein